MNRITNLLINRQIASQFVRNVGLLGGPAGRTGLLTKTPVLKQFLRHETLPGGTPGETLPFRLGNKWWATTAFILYFTIPWWAAYLVVVIQMYKM